MGEAQRDGARSRTVSLLVDDLHLNIAVLYEVLDGTYGDGGSKGPQEVAAELPCVMDDRLDVVTAELEKAIESLQGFRERLLRVYQRV